jgi:spore coat-associated protein N
LEFAQLQKRFNNKSFTYEKEELFMSIKKKLGMAFLTTALGALLIAGGSFALFSDTATNAENTFTAGTVTLEAGSSVISPEQFISNLAPGDSGTIQVTVQNTGSLDAWVRVNEANSILGGALFEGDHPLQIHFEDVGYVLLGSGESTSVTVNYSFPLEAGNEYQGASGSFALSFDAVQARNNTNEAGNGPISWN